MRMEIRLGKKFKKQYKEVDHRTQAAFDRRLHLFVQDPRAPQLHNHALRGRYQGMHSINITGDWRALFRERGVDTNKVIIFEFFGTHSQLYK